MPREVGSGVGEADEAHACVRGEDATVAEGVTKGEEGGVGGGAGGKGNGGGDSCSEGPCGGREELRQKRVEDGGERQGVRGDEEVETRDEQRRGRVRCIDRIPAGGARSFGDTGWTVAVGQQSGWW